MSHSQQEYNLYLFTTKTAKYISTGCKQGFLGGDVFTVEYSNQLHLHKPVCFIWLNISIS